MRFERGGNIKKVLNIGLRAQLEDHNILLIEDEDFSKPIPEDIWNYKEIRMSGKVQQSILDMAHASDFVILSLVNKFMIYKSILNENAYSEAWTKYYLYPIEMLDSCLEFFIRKSRELSDAI